MEIKPIRREADYQVALKEIERLFESQPGTPEGDRMDVLVTLVEAYEAKNFPIPEPDDPVQVLEYYMERYGLSRSDLVVFLGSKERFRSAQPQTWVLSSDDSTTARWSWYPRGSFTWKARL